MPDPVPGRASSAGTRRFADQAVSAHSLSADHFRPAPGELTLSSFGLGTYIGAPDGATDLAVEHAVGVCLARQRVNVIDTAINYRFQRAERSIGRAIAKAIDAGTVQREEIFVSTKNGYLAPDAESKTPVDRWVEEELIRPGVLKATEIVDGSHAMTPRYLEDQFERSRRNLGFETIDLMYLHNAADAQLPVVGRAEFMARLEAAFGVFEEQRKSGHLVAYGLATWDSLRARRGEPTYLSLSDLVAVARKAGGEAHGLRFVQFPFNVGMPEAMVLRNQPVAGERKTLFEAADHFGIGCFTSVPLYQGQLAESGIALGELTSAQSAIQFARSVPGTLGPMVGQKSVEHLSENLAVAERPLWDPTTVTEFLG